MTLKTGKPLVGEKISKLLDDDNWRFLVRLDKIAQTQKFFTVKRIKSKGVYDVFELMRRINWYVLSEPVFLDPTWKALSTLLEDDITFHNDVQRLNAINDFVVHLLKNQIKHMKKDLTKSMNQKSHGYDRDVEIKFCLLVNSDCFETNVKQMMIKKDMAQCAGMINNIWRSIHYGAALSDYYKNAGKIEILQFDKNVLEGQVPQELAVSLEYFKDIDKLKNDDKYMALAEFCGMSYAMKELLPKAEIAFKAVKELGFLSQKKPQPI